MIQSEMQVTYIDHLGSDLNVVNAARVSFNKESELDHTWCNSSDERSDLEREGWKDVTNYEWDEGYHLERLSLQDRKLIDYLAKHNHWSPLAHTSISIRVKAPIFLARQFVKHQVGLVWNEVSRRYVDDEPEFWFPEEWHKRPENAKQGASKETVELYEKHTFDCGGDETGLQYLPKDLCNLILQHYNEMLRQGVAPEEARIILPLNTMTEWIWTGSAVAFARICKLRLDGHAQNAAQDLALLIRAAICHCYPVTWDALMKYNN